MFSLCVRYISSTSSAQVLDLNIPSFESGLLPQDSSGGHAPLERKRSVHFGEGENPVVDNPHEGTNRQGNIIPYIGPYSIYVYIYMKNTRKLKPYPDFVKFFLVFLRIWVNGLDMNRFCAPEHIIEMSNS